MKCNNVPEMSLTKMQQEKYDQSNLKEFLYPTNCQSIISFSVIQFTQLEVRVTKLTTTAFCNPFIVLQN